MCVCVFRCGDRCVLHLRTQGGGGGVCLRPAILFHHTSEQWHCLVPTGGEQVRQAGGHWAVLSGWNLASLKKRGGGRGVAKVPSVSTCSVIEDNKGFCLTCTQARGMPYM